MKHIKSTALHICTAIFSVTLHAMQAPKTNHVQKPYDEVGAICETTQATEQLKNMIITRSKQAQINEKAISTNPCEIYPSDDTQEDAPQPLSDIVPHSCIYRAIENGAEIDILNEHGTPLSHIATTHDPSTLPLLLESGANPNIRNEKNNETLLHKTVRLQNFNASWTLVRYGANPNIRDQSGQTPFTLSVQMPRLFRLFLYEGGNIADLSQRDITSLYNKTVLATNMDAGLYFHEAQILSYLQEKSYITPEDTPQLITESKYQETAGVVLPQDGIDPYHFSLQGKPIMRRACAFLALEHGWWDVVDTILHNYVHKQDYLKLSQYANYLYHRYTKYIPRPHYITRLQTYCDELKKKYDNKEEPAL